MFYGFWLLFYTSFFLFLCLLLPYFAAMYEKTRGIVLHTIPYNDKLSVVHIYTDRFGRISCALPRGAGRSARMARALYMPLTLLDLELEVHRGSELHRIREAHTWMPLPHLLSHPVKASLAMFLSEFLGCVLRSSDAQPQLFSYLAYSVRLLDGVERGLGNFHLCFLVGMMPFMGITPNVEGYSPAAYFDMQEGVFVPARPIINASLTPAEAQFIPLLLRMSYTNMHLFRFSRAQRALVLDRIIAYYGIHFTGMGTLSSPAVLHALFD